MFGGECIYDLWWVKTKITYARYIQAYMPQQLSADSTQRLCLGLHEAQTASIRAAYTIDTAAHVGRLGRVGINAATSLWAWQNSTQDTPSNAYQRKKVGLEES